MQLESLLKENFGIQQIDLAKAKEYQIKYGGRLEQILVNIGSLPDDSLPLLYSHLLDLPMLSLADWNDIETAPDIEHDTLKHMLQNGWVPLRSCVSEMTVCCSDPLNLALNDFIAKQNKPVSIHVASESEVANLTSRFNIAESSEDSLAISDEEDKLRELASEAPTVNLLNSLITKALRQGASDMHLEPFEGRYRVRFRVDGVLSEVETLSARMQLPIVTRLKILSGMDIAEKRRPQDGKIEMKIANQDIDIRVSSLPLNEGESMVMRFLRKDSVRYDMSVIGLSDDIFTKIKNDLTKTSGVILLTGPTGSGKTTTLYTFLNALNSGSVKIVTLEDPVEYQLEGINQVQVNSEIGFGFAEGLRSIVRQDPDIIMLGEIRDKETAQIALQSALTGHLVFSTVHTNDAAGAYTRLLDLGVEEFLLNAALVSVIAQRLTRQLCQECATPHPSAEKLIETYNLASLAKRFGVQELNLLKSNGCEQCGESGFKGRLAITEYLECDDTIKAIPKNSEFINKAKTYNASINNRTLFEDGLYKAILGLTTIEEVIRVAG